jgi:YhcG PDDEXK nuclease domain
VLDDTVKMPDENPAIGIILCKSKNCTIVEYALRESSKPIGVAAYQVFKSLPQELQNQLPNPEQIAKLLDGMELE